MSASLPTHGRQSQALPTSDPWFEAEEILSPLLCSNQPLPVASANLKLERGQVDVDTWREDIYQWLQILKKLFLPSLKISRNNPVEKYQDTYPVIDEHIALLEIAKDNVETDLKEKIVNLENFLIAFYKDKQQEMSSHSQNQNQLHVTLEPPSPVSSPQLFQLPSSKIHPPNKQKNLQSFPEKTGTSAEAQQASGVGPAAVTSLPITTLASPLLASLSSPQLFQLPSSNIPPPKKQKNLQSFPEKTGTSAEAQQASGVGPAAVTSLPITTPASPLLASSDNSQESSVIEQPIQHLLRTVKSMSRATFGASVEAMITACDQPEIYHSSPFGGTSDSSIPETESVTTFPQRTMIKGNDPLMEEIRKINKGLMSTEVEICDGNDTPTSQAKIVKCTFIDLATKHYTVSSKHVSQNHLPIQPLKLEIPGTYPQESPLVLDNSSALASGNMKNEDDLTGEAISRLKLDLRRMDQPLSLETIAKAWDEIANSVFREYAEQRGGGSFSSKYGAWEK